VSLINAVALQVLVTSADSRIRMYSMTNYSQVFKYAGLVNDESHIKATMRYSVTALLCF